MLNDIHLAIKVLTATDSSKKINGARESECVFKCNVLIAMLARSLFDIVYRSSYMKQEMMVSALKNLNISIRDFDSEALGKVKLQLDKIVRVIESHENHFQNLPLDMHLAIACAFPVRSENEIMASLVALKVAHCNTLKIFYERILPRWIEIQKISLGCLLRCDQLKKAEINGLVPRLHSLKLDGSCSFNLRNLTDLSQVRNLDVSGCSNSVANQGLKAISVMTNLENLDLSYCMDITDEGIVELKALRKLKYLYLKRQKFSYNPCITDISLRALAELRSLKVLNLSHCGSITDAGLLSLTTLKDLQKLFLVYCKKITNLGLRAMHSLTNLQTLKLMGSDGISDEGLSELTALTRLKKLKLKYLSFTPAGLQIFTVLTQLENFSLFTISGEALPWLQSLGKLQRLKLMGDFSVSKEGGKALNSCSNLERLDLSWSLITDDGLEDLKDLTKLKILKLGPSKNVTDRGLQHLTSLRNLNTLYLGLCDKITDAGVRALSTLVGLQSLDVRWCTDLTDLAIKEMAVMSRLKALDLSGCTNISDIGALQISAFTTLQKLSIYSYGNKITAAGLMHFSRLEKLCHLDLIEADVTDEVLKSLVTITCLRQLCLQGSAQITDEGTVQLSKLTRLHSLSLRNCEQLSISAVDNLIAALPLTKIDWNGKKGI